MTGPVAALTALLAIALPAPALAAPTPAPQSFYDVDFDARIVPSERVAHVTIRLGPHQGLVRWLRFRGDPARYTGWTGDGRVRAGGEWVEWQPPREGGVLRYTLLIDHLRSAHAYDARCSKNWVLLRGHDLVPTVRVRAENTAYSRSTLTMHVPNGWSVVTGHAQTRKWRFTIVEPHTNFDRPSAWILAGRIGVVRERIAGMKVAIAGPAGHGVRRTDMLAMLRWNLRPLKQILGTLPERLTVVSAGDPMWRGGLSGSHSFFIHAERPLMTPDLTSPMLHELIHTVISSPVGTHGDWIAEGLAEYYSLQLLVRSKTVSQRRYQRAMRRLERRGREAGRLALDDSTGAATAYAVTVLAELNAEILAATAGKASLDNVLVRLAANPDAITNDRFKAIAEEVAGRDLGAFFKARVHPPQAKKNKE